MMNNFDYHKPTTVDEAVKLLGQGETALLAGGMTLLPTIKQRLAAPSALIDLSAMADLKGVREHDKKGVVIGATVTHADVASAALVQDKIPALAKLAGGIGDVQVRHRGTIGGSLANNDPAADYPAALLALAGSVHTNKRTIEADDYFQGLFATALAADEIICHLHFPVPTAAAYVKFSQPASLYALVGVFVAQTADGVRVAVTGAGNDGVFRATALEERLNKDCSVAALDGVSVPSEELIGDMHGSAEYRAALVVALGKRAVAALK